MNSFLIVCTILIVLLSGCSSAKKVSDRKKDNGFGNLHFLGEYDIPHKLQFKNTTVGGLSGIDYEKKKDVYYMICDDPSANGPARFYTAKISLNEKGIDSVSLLDMTPLLNTEGVTYPDIREDRIHSLDAESLRYNPVADEFVYGSEGQRFKNPEGKLLIQNPTIYAAHRDGSFKDSFELPRNMYIRSTENGPRHNSVFEGMTFTEDYRYLFVSVEEPLYEDGPRAATGDSSALIRILKFDTQTRKQVAQYGYKIDAVPYMPEPPGAFKINGVSDMLYAGNNKFIIVERAYITGRLPSYIRVYLADASEANDISSVNSLTGQPTIKLLTKKLLLNMESLGRYIDNIEGITFGPVLPNGHQTLLFVADDNFASTERSQFLLFEILP
ncbi:MAG: esterase-like activity of phytase family protein [Bacteroidota bacterium]